MKPVIDHATTQAIRRLRFPLLMGIVWIHAYHVDTVFLGGGGGASGLGPLATIPREYLSQTLARVCVPLFFLISGFLYFFTWESLRASYPEKTRARWISLGLPYLLWNGLVIVAYALAEQLPGVKDLFSGSKESVSERGWIGILEWWLGWGTDPAAYQFWFVRDLLILMLLSPLWALFRQWLLALPLGLGAFWIAGPDWTTIPSLQSALFFLTGAWFGLRQRSPFHGTTRLVFPMWLLYLLLSIGGLFCSGLEFHRMIHSAGIVAGVAAVCLTGRFLAGQGRLRNWLDRLAPTSFFVFAMHEPTLMLLRKACYRVLRPEEDWMVLVLYVLVPFMVIVVGLVAYVGLKKTAPGVLAVLSGGRGS